MNRRIGAALGVALISGLAAAAILVVLLSTPSAAVPNGTLDQAAVSAAVTDAALTLFPAATPGTPPPASADGVGAFDPDTATWHLRTRAGDPTVFVFGAPGSTPLMGDWDGDGIDTVGTYEPDTTTVTLRNTNSAGTADVTFTLGEPGDFPITGDFDGDGTDTVAVFRPSDGFVYVFNTTGPDTGDPDAVYTPADTSGTLFAGDFDGGGIDTIGSWDPATNTVTTHTPAGALESEFTFTAADGRFFSGDWTGDGADTLGSFDPKTATVHLRYENTSGAPNESYPWGTSSWIPVAGAFGDLSSNVTVNVDGAPQGLAWAIESLYLELGAAPSFDGPDDQSFSLAGVTEDLEVEGIATTAEAYGGQVAVVTTDTDTILAVSDDGWSWRAVGGTLESSDFSLLSDSPRFVVLIGADYLYPDDPLTSFADSIHIYGVNPAAKEGAIVGISRDTAMAYNGPPGPRVEDGMAEISHTMRDLGPDVTTKTIANETGLPIEGWFVTGFGTRLLGTPGFEDLVDAMGGIGFLDIPYATPGQCYDPPATVQADEGDTHIDGRGALAFSRDRKCIPTEHLGAVAHTSNVVRTLSQGLLMKAAVAEVQKLGIAALPSLLDTMDDYVYTNLDIEAVTTLAQTLFEINPGPMPTLGPDDLDRLGYGAYNLNPGDLPNVVAEGCNGYLWRNDLGEINFNQFYVTGNYGTFADFADGTLNTLPIYEYDSGSSSSPYACPWALPPTITVNTDPLILTANRTGGYTGTLTGVTATEGDGDPVSLTNNAPALIPFGDTTVTWTATGSKGLTTTATQTVRVVKPPVVDPIDYFIDDNDSVFEADINWMAAEGITKGCNPPTNDRFCPESRVTRGQMAAFLVRALDLTERLDNPFTDDDDSIFEADIERLAAAGITKGCNPPTNDRFCPDANVTREQMAAFLVRALGYADDGGGNLFIDDDDSIFEGDIDRLGTAGVTKGCNPPSNTRFCPTNNVTRGQMAAFLHRALG